MSRRKVEESTVFEDLKAQVRLYDVRSLAQSAGVAPSTLYFWLTGRTKRPHLPTVVSVARAVGYALVLQPSADNRRLREVA